MILIVGPPPGSAYNFLINVPTYAIVLMTLLVAAGLLSMRLRPATAKWSSPFKCPISVIVLFIFFCVFLIIAPWVPRKMDLKSPRRKGELAWWLGPLCGISVLCFGAGYWLAWARVWPRIRGLELVEREKVTDDGHDYTEFSFVQTGAGKDSRTSSKDD
jgi:amino acid transporter